MEREREITYEDLREIAALRHSFHIDSRLRLEFLSVVSRLLREHEVPVSNRVLSTLTLAVPDELPDGNGHQQNGYDAQFAVKAAAKSGRAAKAKAGKKSPRYPTKAIPPVSPIPPPVQPVPPPIEPVPPPIEPVPPPRLPEAPPIHPIPPMPDAPPLTPPVRPRAPRRPPSKGRKR